MKKLADLCPKGPDWYLDWEEIDSSFPWIHRLHGCPQDEIYHREGDVWIHTRMVAEALIALDRWRERTDDERFILFSSALLHDVAKPACTRHDQDRITSRGHSQRGAIDARRILWEMQVPFRTREQICALIEHHQAPFHLIQQNDAERRVFWISQAARCDLLATLAHADVLGRTCDDKDELLERILLYEELCREHGCLDSPRNFPSPHSRFEYFRSESRNPDYLAHEDFSCSVTMISGFPGAGKDTWITREMPGIPVVSLDALRAELGEEASGSQGRVVQAARERAREFLRLREDFIWNATNLSREIRSQLVDLFTAYRAKIRIVYIEASSDVLFKQNVNRINRVPVGAMERMFDRWQVPTPIEAQSVEFWVDGTSVR